MTKRKLSAICVVGFILASGTGSSIEAQKPKPHIQQERIPFVAFVGKNYGNSAPKGVDDSVNVTIDPVRRPQSVECTAVASLAGITNSHAARYQRYQIWPISCSYIGRDTINVKYHVLIDGDAPLQIVGISVTGFYTAQ